MSLEYVHLGFEAQLDGERRQLPPFVGVTLRGAFGYHLKRLVCQVRGRRCGQCMLQQACPYPAVFEGLPPAGRKMMRLYPAVPQPFVLEVDGPGEAMDGGQELRWGIRLFGPAMRLWPYVVYVFDEIGRKGLGRDRVGYRLCRVYDRGKGGKVVMSEQQMHGQPQVRKAEVERPVRRGESVLRWRFRTPTRIVTDGRVLQRFRTGLELVLAGRRRFELMRHFYGGDDDVVSEDASPRLSADRFRVEDSDLRPWRIRRYSGRQGRVVQLEGLVGQVVVRGPWGEAGAWLGAIEAIHMGKSTSFGLGSVTWQMV